MVVDVVVVAAAGTAASLDLINSVVTRRRIILLSFRGNSPRNLVVAAGQKFAITILDRS